MVSNKFSKYIIAFFLAKITILFAAFIFRDELLNLLVRSSLHIIERRNNAKINAETTTKEGIIFLKNLSYKDNTITLKIDDAKLDIDFIKLFKLSLAFDLNLKNINTKVNEANKDIAFDANLSYEENIKEIQKIDFLISNIIDPNTLPKSKLHLAFDENKKIKLDIIEFPISIYRTITKIIPPKNQELISITDFLKEYIDGGIIKTGKLEITLPKRILELSLKDFICNFEINDIDFVIPNNMPRIKGINTNVKIEDNSVVFDILSGGFDETNLMANSKVILKPHEEVALVEVYASGSTKNLTKFIEKTTLDKIKNNGLDLRKISGRFDGVINITVPLDNDKPNIYLVTSKLKSVHIKALDKKIEFESKSLDLMFNGDYINLKSDCIINKNNAYLNYTYNIDKSEIENDLTLDINLTPQDIMNNIIIKDNEIKLSIKYQNKKDQVGKLIVESDLTNSTMSIKKLGIIKKFGEPAKLKLSSEIKSHNPKFDIKLTSKNLDLSGYAIYSKNTQVAKIKIKTDKDNIDLDFTNNKDMMSLRFVGDVVDLTRVNFLEYIEKNNTQKNIDLDLSVKKVLLKNNINAENIKLKMYCNSKKCISASFLADIGSRKVNIDLDNTSEKERWVLFTDNAGALFKGMGLYTKIKAGTLEVNFEVSKEKKSSGDIIIKNGEFKLDKFVLVDNSLVLKMTSLISLPGLLSIITNNKDVKFAKMSGSFEFDGEKFKLTKSMAEGPYFDFTMLGYVDVNKRLVFLKGGVTPSIYGISFIIKKIPVVKGLFASKKRKGIIYAPYSIKFNY